MNSIYISGMNLSTAQKRIQDRRTIVRAAYSEKGETLVSVFAKLLAKKLRVSEVTIYGDLKAENLIKGKGKRRVA